MHTGLPCHPVSSSLQAHGAAGAAWPSCTSRPVPSCSTAAVQSTPWPSYYRGCSSPGSWARPSCARARLNRNGHRLQPCNGHRLQPCASKLPPHPGCHPTHPACHPTHPACPPPRVQVHAFPLDARRGPHGAASAARRHRARPASPRCGQGGQRQVQRGSGRRQLGPRLQAERCASLWGRGGGVTSARLHVACAQPRTYTPRARRVPTHTVPTRFTPCAHALPLLRPSLAPPVPLSTVPPPCLHCASTGLPCAHSMPTTPCPPLHANHSVQATRGWRWSTWPSPSPSPRGSDTRA